MEQEDGLWLDVMSRAQTVAPQQCGAPATDIEQRLRGENPEQCVVTDRLRANIGMPETFEFDRDDAVELDELILEAADIIARLEADNASLRSKLEEAEGALLLTAGALQAGRRSMAPVVAFTGEWAHLGTRTVHDILDTADRALASLREADHA